MTAGATPAERDAMVAVARSAAELVMRVYATDFAVEMKAHDDPVTRADREANTLICDALARAFPGHGIVAEESAPEGDVALVRETSKERVFYVDPVDGTREFADRNGEFCVMIGLSVGGLAAAGVIVVPVEKKLFYGDVEAGAWVEVDGQSPRALTFRDISDPRACTAVVSRSHMAPRTQAILDALGPRSTFPTGSVGVKAARVLEGAADLYVHASGGAKKWDACAPDAIVRGAGGVLVDLSGDPIRYDDKDLAISNGLIATGPGLLPAVLRAAKQAAARAE